MFLASTQKYTNSEYNENKWLDKYIVEENKNEVININENIFTVNGWNFLVDRSVPKIVESLGKANNKPDTVDIKILEGDKQESDWYTTDIKIQIQGSGYTINDEDVKLENGIRNLIIKEDGIYEITAYLQDDSGNESTQRIIIKRDTSKPKDFKPIDGIGNGTGKQIEIITKAEDLSGISEYRYYLNNEYLATTQLEKYTIKGLEPFVEYELYVIAKDNVGQEKRSESIKFNTGIYLFNNGDEYTQTTGGWTRIYKSGNKTVKKAKVSAYTFVRVDNILDFSINGEGITTAIATDRCCGGAIGISNKIKIDNYKYMKTKAAVGLSGYNQDACCGMVLDSDDSSYLAPTETEADFGVIAYSEGTDTPKTFTWDISGIKGEYRPAIYLQSAENVPSWVNIHTMWLLK